MRKLLVTGITLMSLASIAGAVQPPGVQPIMSECYAPSLPHKDAGSKAWNDYATALNEYSYCKSQKANEAAEALGRKAVNVAEGATDSVKSWFKR